MLEKARKAILDGKDFLYVAVKPAQPLGDAKLREIEELGAMYAQGGSRRSLVVEPQVHKNLQFLYWQLWSQTDDRRHRQTSTRYRLGLPSALRSEGRQEDKNKVIVKSCFAAIPNNEPIGKGGQTSAFTPQQAPSTPPQRIRPAPPPAQPPQDWGAPSNSGWAQDITALPTQLLLLHHSHSKARRGAGSSCFRLRSATCCRSGLRLRTRSNRRNADRSWFRLRTRNSRRRTCCRSRVWLRPGNSE